MASGTVHFEAPWKNGNFGKIKAGLCNKWAMSRPRNIETTTDEAKVSCTRCAKTLGITPVAKAESGSPVGTCQCCFGSFKVPKENVALHGYSRPGCGYIVGRCRGEGHLPFEVSCEQTKKWLAELQQIRSNLTDYLTRLESRKIDSVSTSVPTNERAPGRGYSYLHETVVVFKGDKEKRNPFFPNEPTYSAYRIPSFEEVVENEIATTKRNIKQINSDIQFVSGKINSWVKKPFPAKKGA